MTEAAAPREFRSGPAIAAVLSDERLVRRAAGGDERAFAAIFRRYHQSLYRFCLAILANPEDAQDALQNTMVKALRALPGEERDIQLKPWLYRIAHNESIDLLRRRRDSGQLDAEQVAPGAGIAEEAATRERLRRLVTDLGELPERQRGALVMRELSGLDFDEIAAALGTSPAVARQTLYEARLSLRQMDEGREMSCRAVSKALSDGDGRVTRRRDVRAHLRSCAGCRGFRDQIKARERDLGALVPLPAAGAAALLHGLLGGGSGGGGGGGVAAALGGGAAKSAGGAALLKGAATVAVVAAIGVTAADRGGLIDVGISGGGAKASKSDGPALPGASGVGAAAGVAAAGSERAAAAVGNAVRRDAGAGSGGTPASGHRQSNNASSSEPSTSGAAGAAESHPHGRGHEKQHPSAAAKGQETAATHKAQGHGAGSVNGRPASPSRPIPPAHPTNAGSGKGSSPGSSGSATAEDHSQAGAAGRPAGAEEAPSERESGKKP